MVKISLKDSLGNADYSELDFSKAVLNKIDSLQLFYLRIPFRGKPLRADFVLVQTTAAGKVKAGKIVHMQGEESGYGGGKIKRRKFDGSILISSLDRKTQLNSSIDDGFITALHQNKNTRDMVFATDVLPEVVVVAYVQGNGISFSTWMLLQSLFYDSGTGTGTYSSFYGAADGGSLDYTGGGTADAGIGSVDATYSSVTIDPGMAVDVDTYVNKDAIDIEQYLKCFDNIPDDGAICSIEIFSDIPVDTDPNKFFDFSTGSPGHTFISIKKTNGTQSVLQYIGFYPKTGWKNAITDAPMDAKFVDDGQHEYNASYSKTLTPDEFKSILTEIRYMKNTQYDIDNFNCTDWALDIFNKQGYGLQIPLYDIPGNLPSVGTSTPQGVFNQLMQMKKNNDTHADKIGIGFLKGYAANSSGPCF